MKQLLSLLLCLSIIVPTMAKKEQGKQNVFPDGTPISEWFLQTKMVHPDSLGKKYNLSDYGIESNPHIVQTQKIQKVIDEAAANGGGVIYIPEGIYKSGSLFFKQGTHLYLSKGATLLGSENIMDFPLLMTRIESMPTGWIPLLLAAKVQLTETALPTGKLSAYVANGILNVQTRMKCGHGYFT